MSEALQVLRVDFRRACRRQAVSPITRKDRHAIRNKLQLIVSYTELRKPKEVIYAVREIDRMLG